MCDASKWQIGEEWEISHAEGSVSDGRAGGRAETERCLENLAASCAAAGTSLDNVAVP
jgi:enamine deaminase RidA (YjgF/YER057c/UK114 family)